MRHNKKFNHLSRTASHRAALLSNMATSLILHKRITTTLQKAKALSSFKTEGARQNIIKTENDIVIYADCYNAIARSIKSAIDAASCIPIKGKRILVLGDIEEAGSV